MLVVYLGIATCNVQYEKCIHLEVLLNLIIK